MTLEELTIAIETGKVDTVVVAITDMQGRLQGKRFHARFFLDEVVPHGTEACAYLLAVDTDMNTVDGYPLSSWDNGYGDFALEPDISTSRIIPWQPGTILMLADVLSLDHDPVAVSPRQVLRKQIARLGDLGWTAYAGTELEFIVFEGGYEQAWDSGYRGLVPANRYNVDYSVLGTGRVEPLLRDIRNSMTTAGLTVESAKGECNPGQHEIAFRYKDALTTADQHVIYKTGAKEIAANHGYALTFMAKPNEREGNSCHIHLSFRAAGGEPVMSGDRPYGLSEAGEHIVAGLLSGLRDLTLLLAPTINSYKRYVSGSFAPTAIAWGPDNRTCALRLVGHGPSLRVECRVPGGDVNPYLAIAALIAGALDGVDRSLPLPDPITGNAYDHNDVSRVPASMDEALAAWTASSLVTRAFGKDVTQHYANMARVEIEAYGAAVTDWELRRYFERI
ncbi:MAG: glutamine synthetase family protein [Streptosporangiaceae bacterium]|jgi:glutamine synthetase